MRCPECKIQGLDSKYYIPNTSYRAFSKICPFYDEEGRYHNHDGSMHTSESYCSRGHKFVHRTILHCCEEHPGMNEIINISSDCS